VIAGYITAGASGQVVIFTDPSLGVSLTTQVNNGLIVGVRSLGWSGQISIGSTVPAAATAGGTQAVPATVFGYIEAFVGGIAFKIP
jgi:hypothetical protein